MENSFSDTGEESFLLVYLCLFGSISYLLWLRRDATQVTHFVKMKQGDGSHWHSLRVVWPVQDHPRRGLFWNNHLFHKRVEVAARPSWGDPKGIFKGKHPLHRGVQQSLRIVVSKWHIPVSNFNALDYCGCKTNIRRGAAQSPRRRGFSFWGYGWGSFASFHMLFLL